MADEIQNDIQLAISMGDAERLAELIELQEAQAVLAWEDSLDHQLAVEA